MIRVAINQRFERMGWDVYIMQLEPGTTHLASMDELGELRFDRSFPPGAGGYGEQPTFHIRDDVLKALVDEATDKLPADGAMASHLKDAITVRDRLLSMIERKAAR